MKSRKILISILLVIIMVATTACKFGAHKEVSNKEGSFLDLFKFEKRDETNTITNNEETNTETEEVINLDITLNRSTGITLDKNGNLVIQRISRKEEEPMGEELGVAVVDSYYESYILDGTESELTLSCIDLSKIDELMVAFRDVAQYIYDLSDDTVFLSRTAKGFRSAESYGGNNKAEGYTNMVDLGSILSNLTNHVEKAEATLELLEDCVTYMKNGKSKSRASGLSIYYPLEIQGSTELATLKDICISPH